MLIHFNMCCKPVLIGHCSLRTILVVVMRFDSVGKRMTMFYATGFCFKCSKAEKYLQISR